MNFKNKYKDREPLDTIKIINDFFKDRGFEVVEKIVVETEIGTYCSIFGLLYGKKEVLKSVGKGVTRDFCVASGLAELYERFCTKYNFFTNPLISNKIIAYNKKNYGFSLDKDEKILSFDEFLNQPFVHNLYAKFVNNNNVDDIYRCLSKIWGDFVGIPYFSILNGDVKYYDPRFLCLYHSSSGLAAGNSIEEVLVQGISELFERHVMTNFVSYKKNQKSFFYINLENIKNQTLKELIDKIHSNGNEIYVFDLSFNYSLPVVATLLINNCTNNIDVNFASHPIFDIALERTLTETFQSLNYQIDTVSIMNNSIKNANVIDVFDDYTSAIKSFVLDDLLLLAKKVDYYNEGAFMSDNIRSNKDIFKWIQNLASNLGINLYYHDFSLCNNMFAVKIYSPDLLDCQNCKLKKCITEDFDSNKSNVIFNYYDFLLVFLKRDNYSRNKKVINNYISFDILKSNFYTDLCFVGNPLSIYGVSYETDVPFLRNVFALENKQTFFKNICNNFYAPFIKNVYLLNQYNRSNLSLFEKKKILKFLNGFSYSSFSNVDYIYYGVLLPFKNEYNSIVYDEFIKKICDKNH